MNRGRGSGRGHEPMIDPTLLRFDRVPFPLSGKWKVKTTVTARCVMCKATREIEAREVPKGEMPQCHKCFGVMVAVKAEVH